MDAHGGDARTMIHIQPNRSRWELNKSLINQTNYWYVIWPKNKRVIFCDSKGWVKIGTLPPIQGDYLVRYSPENLKGSRKTYIQEMPFFEASNDYGYAYPAHFDDQDNVTHWMPLIGEPDDCFFKAPS